VLLTVLEIGLRLGGYGYSTAFFKQVRMGAEDFFVQNEDFSLRFFPREIARNPSPTRFPAKKAPGTFRIFILGESAAMGDPAESFAPSRYLEMLLQEKYPDRKFEVINVAFTAINSHVILPIARDCAAHEGDLWIVYMGNNEMVGPFGAATVFGRQAAPLPYVRLITGLQRLRAGQWLVNLGRKLTSPGEKAQAWGGMGMFLNNQVPPDSPRKETVYRNFQKNLHDIVGAGVGSGAKVLLNTVAVNLPDCPPFATMSGASLTPADRAAFDQLYTNAMRSLEQRDWAAAAAGFKQAAALPPNSAELQYQWGRCLLAQGDAMAAREHLQLACDADALPFRTDSRLNAIIRKEREVRAGQALLWCDAAQALGAGNPGQLCGQETFFEHVHFDFDGRYRLALAWAEQVRTLLPVNTNAWISQVDCESRLGLTEWNRAQAIHFMVERMQLPPLSGQANNARRREALEARIQQAHAQMNAENAVRARRAFLDGLGKRPNDFFLHQNFAVFLELTGDLAGAAAEWQKFRDLLPQDSLGYFQVGRLGVVLQRYAEAEASLRTALAIRPSRSEAWIELGNALALQKKYPEALDRYTSALARDPQNSQLLLRRGKVLGYLNRHAEATESYRAALRLNPGDGLSHFELGVELLAVKDFGGAGQEFREAARLTPDRAAARFNYGVWLMQQNQREAAVQEFEAVLRLQPGNAQAQKNLAALRARDARAP